MKDYSSLFILLLIILLLVGFIFLRRSGILTINKSANENSSNYLNDYYDKVNPDDHELPDVQNTVNQMQITKH